MNSPTATLLDRTKSSTIDTLLLISLAFLIADFLSYFEDVPTWLRAILFSSLVMYEPIFITFGGTLGNKIMKIRIRNSKNDSTNLNLIRSIIRFTLKILFGSISYTTIFKNPRKRAIHDLIAGATTVKI
jgi:uncharacterized RDD family membrane protein YckC